MEKETKKNMNDKELLELMKKTRIRKEALENFIRKFTRKWMDQVKILFVSSLLLCLHLNINAQNVIITDDSAYTPGSTNALLEIKSGSNNKGILIPRLSTTQRTGMNLSSTNDKGLIVYDTNTKSFWYYDGTAWTEVGGIQAGMQDGDSDTKIQVEESADEDHIRFDISGSEAVVIDSNANMGIGISSPVNKLDIIGNTGVFGNANDLEGLKLQPSYTSGNTSSRLFFCETDNNKYGFSWLYAGSDNPTIGGTTFTLPDNTLYLLRHNNSESGDIAISVDRSTGNIGIGTEPNSSKLYVEGEANFNGNVSIGSDPPNGILDVYQEGQFSNESVDQELISTNGSSFTYYYLWQSFTAGISGYLTKIELYDNGSYGNFMLKIYSGQGTSGTLLGTSRMITRSGGSGNVAFKFDNLISVTSGQQYTFKLEIEGQSAHWKFLRNTSNAYSGGVLHYTYNTYSNADTRFRTYVATSNSRPPKVFILNEDNNVGIGTSVPQNARLQIEGSGTYNGVFRMNNTGTNGASFFMASTNDDWNVGSDKFIMGHGSPSSSNADIILSSDGNLGVGVTSPTNKLEVNGTVKIGEYILPSTDGTNGQVLKTDGSGNLSWLADNNTVYWSETGGNVFRNSGNVGIGVISPSQRLTIDGNILLSDGDYMATDELRAIDGDGLKLYDDGGNGIFIDDGGQVGVGTTSPTDQLTIDGGVDVTGAFEVNGSVKTDSHLVYTLGGTGDTRKVERMWRGTIRGNGSDYTKIFEDDYIELYIESTASTEVNITLKPATTGYFHYSIVQEINNGAKGKRYCSSGTRTSVMPDSRYDSQGVCCLVSKHQDDSFPMYKITMHHNDDNISTSTYEHWTVVVEAYY